MLNLLKYFKKINLPFFTLFFIFFFNFILLANSKNTEIKKNNLKDFSLNLALGNLSAGGGLVAEYYFFNAGIHHVSGHLGLGYFGLAGYSIGFRYGLGNKDRLTVDLTYGLVGFNPTRSVSTSLDSGGNYSETSESSKPRGVYSPSFTIGYQRMTNWNFTFFTGIGFSYVKGENFTPLGTGPFIPTLNIGVGYTF